MVTKTGKLVWVDMATSVIERHDDEVVMAFALRDISARREAELAAREAENWYERIVENVLDGIVTIDERGVVQSFNPGAERLFGYDAAEVIGQNVKILTPEPYRTDHDRYIQRYLETGEARVIGIGREVEGQRKDGTVFPLGFAVGESTTDEQRMFVGILRDLSAEAAAREWESRFERIVTKAQEGIFQTTPDGRYLLANQALADLYGYRTPDELIAHLQDIGSQLYADPERRADFLRGMQRDSQVTNFESQIVRVDGSTRWISENVSAVHGGNGELSHYEGTAIDIASRKASEEALNRELETARRVQQALQPVGAYGKGRLKVAGACVPAREVGGDFFNWVGWDDESVVVTVGDVMGKGIPAAMIQAMVQSRLDAELSVDAHNSGRAGSLDLGQSFTRINRCHRIWRRVNRSARH